MRRNLLAWILYSGFVYEKTGVYSNYWKNSFRKRISKQIVLWRVILAVLVDINNDFLFNQLLDDFSHKYLRDFPACYANGSFTYEHITQEEHEISSSTEEMHIHKLMVQLVNELEILNRTYIFRKRDEMTYIMRALHNLPRYFFRLMNIYILIMKQRSNTVSTI